MKKKNIWLFVVLFLSPVFLSAYSELDTLIVKNNGNEYQYSLVIQETSYADFVNESGNIVKIKSYKTENFLDFNLSNDDSWSKKLFRLKGLYEKYEDQIIEAYFKLPESAGDAYFVKTYFEYPWYGFSLFRKMMAKKVNIAFEKIQVDDGSVSEKENVVVVSESADQEMYLDIVWWNFIYIPFIFILVFIFYVSDENYFSLTSNHSMNKFRLYHVGINIPDKFKKDSFLWFVVLAMMIFSACTLFMLKLHSSIVFAIIFTIIVIAFSMRRERNSKALPLFIFSLVLTVLSCIYSFSLVPILLSLTVGALSAAGLDIMNRHILKKYKEDEECQEGDKQIATA